MKHTKKGFTLLELLLVLGFMALLMAFFYPVFSNTRKANETMARLDVYHDIRRIDQVIYEELKLSTGILYPPAPKNEARGDEYNQVIFRNHINHIFMLYLNKKDELILFNYDNVKDAHLSLGKTIGRNVKNFTVRRYGSSMLEYKLTFEINNKPFIISNKVTMLNVF